MRSVFQYFQICIIKVGYVQLIRLNEKCSLTTVYRLVDKRNRLMCIDNRNEYWRYCYDVAENDKVNIDHANPNKYWWLDWSLIHISETI